MSCSSAAVWIRSCSRSSRPEHPGDLARVARDGGGVARGHRVAHRQRLQHGREQPHLQRGEFARALVEFLAALLGLDAGPQDVEEDEQHDGGQPDRRHAEMAVGERDARGQQAVANSDGQRRDEGPRDARIGTP